MYFTSKFSFPGWPLVSCQLFFRFQCRIPALLEALNLLEQAFSSVEAEEDCEARMAKRSVVRDEYCPKCGVVKMHLHPSASQVWKLSPCVIFGFMPLAVNRLPWLAWACRSFYVPVCRRQRDLCPGRQTNGKSIINRCSPVDAAQARRHEEALEIAKHAVQSADAILDHLEVGDFAFKARNPECLSLDALVKSKKGLGILPQTGKNREDVLTNQSLCFTKFIGFIPWSLESCTVVLLASLMWSSENIRTPTAPFD